jgi:hypothetical protein
MGLTAEKIHVKFNETKATKEFPKNFPQRIPESSHMKTIQSSAKT